MFYHLIVFYVYSILSFTTTNKLTNLFTHAGCDTGFGHLTALTLNEVGFHVFAGCLLPDKDGARGLQIKAKNPTKMTIVPIDVTNDFTVRLAYEQVEKYVKDANLQLHALVNNAGICPTFEVEWGSIDLFKKTLDVNTVGMVLVTKTFLPLIRASEGRIVNVNSIAARYSVPTMVAYCMSKHASLAFTEGLRREMTKFNVKVISIEPGFYNTPMANTDLITRQMETVWREADPIVKEAYGDHYFKRVSKQTPQILLLTNQDVSQVPNAIKHAIMNKYPLHNYLVDGSWFRYIVIIGQWIFPQETFEWIWKNMGLFSGRSKPLPGTHQEDKKRT
jgi:NAD(P)-dependent dehydrogenase (short-subunit alcohol dehydrogenase family)